MSKKAVILLSFITLLAALLRLYGITWDQGFNLHPDERAIILFSLPLHFPTSLHQFLSPASPLNPHFFAYGSFPLYLLKAVAATVTFFTTYPIGYGNIAIIGRLISALCDVATLIVVFFLGKKLFSETVGLIAALCYALATFPIQVSHFYAVDTVLTFFMTLTLFVVILFYQHPSSKKALLIGFLLGIGVATKDSALALLAPIGFALIADFLFVLFQQNRLAYVKHLCVHFLLYSMIICVAAFSTFLFFEPYAFIDFATFWMQTLQQAQMTHDAFAFPYTLQYVGKIPYVYELQNIFFWGLGPVISTFGFIGLFLVGIFIYKKSKKQKWAEETILLVFFFSYFLVVGKFAIGFMRYMLPAYPILTLFAGVAIAHLFSFLKKKNYWILPGAYVCLFILISYWAFSFMHIYTQPNTRVQATTWILTHIPPGSAIAVEHWDDSLPLLNQQAYTMLTLPLYNPDTKEKWDKINATLQKADYIIIASNRLYVPLQKLADCSKYPPPFCYPLTAAYYKNLFRGTLGFTKVAEFSIYPTLPFTNIRINDQTADESFTVYDHPKVMIFKKMP